LQRLEDLKKGFQPFVLHGAHWKGFFPISFPVSFEVQDPASPFFEFSNPQADAWPVFWRNTGKKIENNLLSSVF
jgi:hypothetical protein